MDGPTSSSSSRRSIPIMATAAAKSKALVAVAMPPAFIGHDGWRVSESWLRFSRAVMDAVMMAQHFNCACRGLPRLLLLIFCVMRVKTGREHEQKLQNDYVCAGWWVV